MLCAAIKVRIVKCFKISKLCALLKIRLVEIFFFLSMDLGMFDKICPSLKTRALIEERRFDMNRSDKNNERYVIHMHRKNVWTNEWMQDPRNNLL
jgi:hypothetical protein